jgi:hypothetical protein
MPETEQEVVRSLDVEEVKDIIAMRIAQAVRDSLDKTCYLFGCAYPKFKANWRIDVTLENFGQEIETFVTGDLHTHEIKAGQPVLTGAPINQTTVTPLSGEIPYTPPNVLRKAHGLPVPTIVKRDDGGTEQKAVMFKRTERRPKLTGEDE